MRPRTLLELGRISNLPTVWSNVLAGALLSGGELRTVALVLTALAGTAFYVGGMFLNDAFDADIDARERPERPIPSGRASLRAVFGIGFGLLAGGLALLVVSAVVGWSVSPAGSLAAGLATATLVVVYDRWHKGLSWSPVVMGSCRGGLYLMGAFAVSARPAQDVVVGAIALTLYVVGLTHIARFETASRVGRTWPTALVLGPALLVALRERALDDLFTTVWGVLIWVFSVGWALYAVRLALLGGRARIGRAVVSLIAGISLADAVLMAGVSAFGAAGLAVLAFVSTLAGQRFVRGT